MSAIAPLTLNSRQQLAASAAASEGAPADLEVRGAFQDFVAGTFYKTMLKSLRDNVGKPAYFHGGQAEEFFQSHLDQHVAESLARQHGAVLSEPLFQQYQRSRGAAVTSGTVTSGTVTSRKVTGKPTVGAGPAGSQGEGKHGLDVAV